MTSEFGKGFTYCIGLFLAHAEREDHYGDLWFNSSADHLFDLRIPEQASYVLKNKISYWQGKCITWRLEKYTKEDKLWAIQTAKDILREWDGLYVETEKGNYE